jgi:rod shape-determining protein MreC
MPYSNDPIRYKISAKLKLKSSWQKLYKNIKIIAFLIAALALFYFSPNLKMPKKLIDLYEQVSIRIYDVSNSIANKLHSKKQDVTGYIHLKKKYDELKEENDQLNIKLFSYTTLLAENMELRKLSKFSLPKGKLIKSTRIAMQSFDNYIKLAQIPIGYDSGIKEGHIVVNDKGVVGRVISTGPNSAKVLLITSPDSQIPVIFANSRSRAILGGEYSGKLELTIMHGESLPEIDELVLTSGDGGYFPPTLIVGKVTKVGEDFVEVTPVFDINDTTVVSIIEN